MSAKHTPGPWVAELGADGAFAIEADRQGITGGMLVLASRNSHPLMAEQMHANARLIAAAPDLLEALQQAYEHINGGSGIKTGMDFHNMWEQCSAAIAKAAGDANG